MRGLSIAALLLGCACVAGEPDPFAERALAFNHRWNKFFRAYLGCPAVAHDVSQCEPRAGRLDLGEFSAAKREARKLFEL